MCFYFRKILEHFRKMLTIIQYCDDFLPIYHEQFILEIILIHAVAVVRNRIIFKSRKLIKIRETQRF